MEKIPYNIDKYFDFISNAYKLRIYTAQEDKPICFGNFSTDFPGAPAIGCIGIPCQSCVLRSTKVFKEWIESG